PNVTCPKQNKLLNMTILVPKRDSPTSPFNPTITYHPRICVYSYAYAWHSHPLATDQHPTHTTTQSTPPAHFLFPTHMRGNHICTYTPFLCTYGQSTHRPFLCVNTPRPPTSKNHVCVTFQSNYELATISCPSWPSHAVRAHKQAVKPRSSKMWVNKRWLTNP
ncbi:hypothetical protein PIB30_104920, partial [Stylosanthes scabra]|nr:hypothetical protein [Stylosanthes scabra]